MQAALWRWRVGSRQLQGLGQNLQREGGNGELQPRVASPGKEVELFTCLTEMGEQDRVVGWVGVACEFLPLHFGPRPSMRGCDGWYCRPMGQHPSLSIKGRLWGECLFLSFLLQQCPGCPGE